MTKTAPNSKVRYASRSQDGGGPKKPEPVRQVGPKVNNNIILLYTFLSSSILLNRFSAMNNSAACISAVEKAKETVKWLIWTWSIWVFASMSCPPTNAPIQFISVATQNALCCDTAAQSQHNKQCDYAAARHAVKLKVINGFTVSCWLTISLNYRSLSKFSVQQSVAINNQEPIPSEPHEIFFSSTPSTEIQMQFPNRSDKQCCRIPLLVLQESAGTQNARHSLLQAKQFKVSIWL